MEESVERREQAEAQLLAVEMTVLWGKPVKIEGDVWVHHREECFDDLAQARINLVTFKGIANLAEEQRVKVCSIWVWTTDQVFFIFLVATLGRTQSRFFDGPPVLTLHEGEQVIDPTPAEVLVVAGCRGISAVMKTLPIDLIELCGGPIMGLAETLHLGFVFGTNEYRCWACRCN
eukprot:scaffold16330_cov102-Cylindrotheca_fusiformis.AAC.3